jgi:hypothetical protein
MPVKLPLASILPDNFLLTHMTSSKCPIRVIDAPIGGGSIRLIPEHVVYGSESGDRWSQFGSAPGRPMMKVARWFILPILVLILAQCSRNGSEWVLEGALPDGKPFRVQATGPKPSLSYVEAAVFVKKPNPRAVGAHSFGRTGSFVVDDDAILVEGCGSSIVITPYPNMRQTVRSTPVKYTVKCHHGFPAFELGEPYTFGSEPETDIPPAANFVRPNFRITSGCRPGQFVVCSKDKSLMATFESPPSAGFRISGS